MFGLFRRMIFGSPLPSSRAAHERLIKLLALPVFSSDAISSVAYATEEILLGLALAGTAVATSTLSLDIAVAIIVLLAIVATSYRQTIFAYPSGGGSYIVAKDNLGDTPGLVAGAALMIDYVLTVAVSVSSGVAAILSFASPEWQAHRVAICVAVVFFVALANLRGVRESGLLFAAPTYTFIVSAAAVIGIGLYRVFLLPESISYHSPPMELRPIAVHEGAAGAVFAFVILRAFASGCSAMTGTEAISNGIPAFRPPESRNAAATLTWMAAILATVFFGMGFLAYSIHVIPMSQTAKGYETVLSQIATTVVGRNWLYYLFQAATMGILVLAANTAYADFPRLGSIMARDRYLPRQLFNVGDRLVFSNGIVVLAILASILIFAFGGVVNQLIPLYAIGVFLSFTLSQAGMLKRFVRLKEPGWKARAAVSGIGAAVTAVVAVVQAVTKASEGAWIVLILIPTLVFIFTKIHRHYVQLGDQLRLTERDEFKPIHNTVLVLTPSVHRGVLRALEYAITLSTDVRAVHVEVDPVDTAIMMERWERWGGGVPLVVLESPYRSLLRPLMEYLEESKKESEGGMVTVVIPEFVPAKWWHKLLHNQSGILLKFALLFRKDIVTTNVRYYIDR